MEERVVSRREFSRLRGPVFAPAALTDDMSDYVRVNKGSLIDRLRVYGLEWVRYYVDRGDILFAGAYEVHPEG